MVRLKFELELKAPIKFAADDYADDDDLANHESHDDWDEDDGDGADDYLGCRLSLAVSICETRV